MRIILLFAFFTFPNVVFGQSKFEKFKQLYAIKDTTKIKMLLREWESANPNDPEFYTCAFNYYYSISKEEVLSLQNKNPNKDSYQLTDSTGKVAGYLTSNLGYNEARLKTAFGYIDKGIAKFPNRLDMRFGKIYLLGEFGEYRKFSDEILKTIEYSVTIKNKWLWTENNEKDDAENFMLSTVQAYLKQLFDANDDSLLTNMIQIGETTLKYYPKNVEILSTTAVAFMLTQKYDKAIVYLKQAEFIDPKDCIVLNNIAHTYKLIGDKANSIKYYKLMEKYGDQRTKQQAESNIKQLEK
jgi:tetratricopeptide (TPR) repeat protein